MYCMAVVYRLLSLAIRGDVHREVHYAGDDSTRFL
jgi:hypothetical protein